MKKQITLSTDKKSVSEGEYIEIIWACDACPDSLYLSIDSEHTQHSIAVSDTGTTRIPVPKANGKMTVKHTYHSPCDCIAPVSKTGQGEGHI